MCVSHTHYKDTLLDTTLLVFGHLSGSRVGRSRVLWTDLTVFDFVFVFVYIVIVSVWFWFSLLFDSHLTSPHLRSSCVYEVCNYLSRTKRKTDYLIASVLAL